MNKLRGLWWRIRYWRQIRNAPKLTPEQQADMHLRVMGVLEDTLEKVQKELDEELRRTWWESEASVPPKETLGLATLTEYPESNEHIVYWRAQWTTSTRHRCQRPCRPRRSGSRTLTRTWSRIKCSLWR